MRTNIDIDDDLMAEAMKAGGFSTKRETVEAALRLLAQRRRAYADALALGGQVDWEGDLDAWRRDKPRASAYAPPARNATVLRVAEPAPAPYKAAKGARKAAPGKAGKR
jgi:Arc/MetJ family transcription regulator